MGQKKGLKLHLAISLLVIVSVVSSIIVNWYTSTNALKTSLKEELQQNNYQYAKKISFNTQELLNMMKDNLTVAARLAGRNTLSQDTLDLWMNANSTSFNSVFMMNADGVIGLISPATVNYKNGTKVRAGMKIESSTMKEALSMREPFISQPYLATSGQLIVLMTAPVFDRIGDYKGLIGGTIYLESQSALSNLFQNHEYGNGSYVYVVDQKGHIIYHPDASRINEKITNNKVINKVINGESGTAQIVNSQGKEFFVGYAFEEKTGWGIVSQTPTTVLKEPIRNLLKNMVIQSVPLFICILFLAGILASNLTKPLSDLASFSEDAFNKKKAVPIDALKVQSHIYEIHQLYHHLRSHIDLLNQQIQIDGLTGIANRKTFDNEITDYVNYHIPFSLIMLDIDKFKRVNDTYGHLVGDEVLKYLASTMLEFQSQEDLCFRYGGEEFGILLKNKTEADAYWTAERLRKYMADTESPTGTPITISIGVTSMQQSDKHPKDIIERADAALYSSKANGRNKTTIFKNQNKSLHA